MFRFVKLSLVVCLLSLILLFEGCSKATDYSSSNTTWGDVNQKFIELEQQRKDTLQTLKNKSSASISP